MPPRCASPRIDKVYVNYPRSSRHSPSWQRDFSLASYERIKLLFLASQAGAHAMRGAPRGDGRASRAGLGLHAGFGILTDPAAAKSRLPAGSYGRAASTARSFGSIRLVGLVMTGRRLLAQARSRTPSVKRSIRPLRFDTQHWLRHGTR
jgi:hypothetical protein